MALVKHNNNSISELTTPGSLAQGKMTLISSQTASGSASIEFTSGIDSTYPIYKFEFINMHSSSQGEDFTFQGSTDGGSNYGVTVTSTLFMAQHDEADTTTSLAYDSSRDLAQSTGLIKITRGEGGDDSQNSCGELLIFNPSSTTFVKHFICRTSCIRSNETAVDHYTSGYFNTTSSLDAFQFKYALGNIGSGTIKLYGIGD